MLKKLTARHRDIIRRLILGETPVEISMELGVNQNTLSRLIKDPLFVTELTETEARLEKQLSEKGGVMDRLTRIAGTAVGVCADAVDGQIDNEKVPMGLRLKSAWDVLDRTGYSKTSKMLVTDDPAQLVIDAYAERQTKEATGS